MNLFIQDAWAQGAPASATDPLMSMLPLVAIFVVFYFLLIRPQSKRTKEHKETLAKLAVGDEVVTAGGVLGRITEISEQFARIEVADGVVIKVQRQTISTVVPKGTIKNA